MKNILCQLLLAMLMYCLSVKLSVIRKSSLKSTILNTTFTSSANPNKHSSSQIVDKIIYLDFHKV